MQSRLIRVFFLSLFFLSAAVSAEETSPPYSASLEITDRTPEALTKVLPEAVKQTLLRLTGSETIIDSPAVKKALPHAEQWISSYHYENRTEAGETKLWVDIDFDHKSIDQLIKGTEVTVKSESGAASPSSETVRDFEVEIVGIKDLDDYAKINQSLSQLQLIQQVEMAGVNPDGMLIKIKTTGTEAELIEVLNGTKELVQETIEQPDGTSKVLRYRWALYDSPQEQ